MINNDYVCVWVSVMMVLLLVECDKTTFIPNYIIYVYYILYVCLSVSHTRRYALEECDR